jgi:Meiotically up-regulated gene 113
MNKQRILDEIRRTAGENGGAPLGVDRFATETGIKESDWRGRYWARWNDAVSEAGITPNMRQKRSDRDEMLGQLAAYVRELGRYPTVAEMRLRKRVHPAFPNHKVLDRLGTRYEILQMLHAFCERAANWSDVSNLCTRLLAEAPEPPAPHSEDDEVEPGHVYLALMRVGREKRYKIGKANLVEQRTRQVAVSLPEELELIHAITTDDAYGIEGYWHRRFADKRRGGEWFELNAADVNTFKRRKVM